MKVEGLIKGVLKHSPQELKDLPSPYKLTSRITGPRKRPSLGAHPHELGGFGLIDSSDSKANFLDS